MKITSLILGIISVIIGIICLATQVFSIASLGVSLAIVGLVLGIQSLRLNSKKKKAQQLYMQNYQQGQLETNHYFRTPQNQGMAVIGIGASIIGLILNIIIWIILIISFFMALFVNYVTLEPVTTYEFADADFLSGEMVQEYGYYLDDSENQFEAFDNFFTDYVTDSDKQTMELFEALGIDVTEFGDTYLEETVGYYVTLDSPEAAANEYVNELSGSDVEDGAPYFNLLATDIIEANDVGIQTEFADGTFGYTNNLYEPLRTGGYTISFEITNTSDKEMTFNPAKTFYYHDNGTYDIYAEKMESDAELILPGETEEFELDLLNTPETSGGYLSLDLSVENGDEDYFYKVKMEI